MWWFGWPGLRILHTLPFSRCLYAFPLPHTRTRNCCWFINKNSISVPSTRKACMELLCSNHPSWSASVCLRPGACTLCRTWCIAWHSCLRIEVYSFFVTSSHSVSAIKCKNVTVRKLNKFLKWKPFSLITLFLLCSLLFEQRQGLVTDKMPLHVLIERYFPLEYRKLLIPVAVSGNKVIPCKWLCPPGWEVVWLQVALCAVFYQ